MPIIEPARHRMLPGVVVKNRWREVFDGTIPDGWEPTMSVSVVIASYNSKTLPLTLASLAAQDYPEHLLDVVVVDDGSEPPVELGEFVHPNTQLIRVQEGWGRSNATDIGIKATRGDIIYWVDADMILFRDNVRRHAVFAHFIPEAATIGHKGFVEEWDFTPEQVFREVTDGSIAQHWDPATLHRHWSLDIFDATDDLNSSEGRNYSTHMGACATVTREVYDRTFGQDLRLHLGEDTEIAYQLWQAGAVFIPVNEARTWHLGRATVQDHAAAVAHHNDVHFAQRMPIPRYRRSAANRIWEVPLIRAVVVVDAMTAKYARQCVDRILNSTESDVQVDLVGPWGELHDGRRKMLVDPNNELYLVHEWFRSDNRVRLVTEEPRSVFPSPYRLDVPVTAGFSSDTLRQIYRHIDGRRLGLVRVFPTDDDDPVIAWDSAAVSRARKYIGADDELMSAVDEIWGSEWMSAETAQIVDLREADLSAPVTRLDSAASDLQRVVSRLEGELSEARSQVEQARADTQKLAERMRDSLARRSR
jgi:glycosyltransferase involved in cell wall biosynthesis